MIFYRTFISRSKSKRPKCWLLPKNFAPPLCCYYWLQKITSMGLVQSGRLV